MLKKGFAILAAFVCMLFCFTGCGLNSSGADKNPAEPGETFKGAVSDEYYDSEQAAAKAFLHNELDVTADDFNNSAEFRQVAIFYTEFIKTENSGELSLDEVKDLIALESDKEDLVKAEKISVEFSPRSDSALYADYVGELDESLEQTFILLSYSDGRVKYLTPLPEIDELCTKSYFDSVLDVSQYKNFTVDYKYKEDKIPEDLKIEFHQSYLTKYTENSSCEIPETVELYYDGFTLDDFMERYEWNIFFGEMTLDDVEKLYNRYSESDKPFAVHPRYDIEEYIIPMEGKYYRIVGNGDDYGLQDYSYEDENTGEVSEPRKPTRLLLSTFVSGKTYLEYTEVYSSMYVKTENGFSTYTSKQYFYGPFCKSDITVQNGRLAVIKSNRAGAEIKMSLYDFGTTEVNLPDAAKSLLNK